jgi:bla regulator protein BlaR1
MIPALPLAAWASGEMVGNHLWQSTLVAAAAALLALTLRKNRAHVRYWLWLAASVKFLIPFTILAALGSQFAWRSSEPVQPAVRLVVHAVSQPFSQPVLRVAPQISAATAFDGLTVLVPVVLAALAGVWLAGCLALMATWTIRWRRVAAAVRRGSRLEDGREVRALRRLEHIHGIKRPIPLISSIASLEPGVFGILHPVLLWPHTIAERLDDRQIESIITHELCHVLRRDNLAAALHMVVQALFWFHPLVWWLGTRLVDERERACDEEVIRLGSEPRVYAESILKTCQLCVESPLVCMAGVTGSDLEKRIEQILKPEDGAALNGWRKLLLATAAVLAVGVPIAVGVVNAPRLRAQAPAASIDRRGFGPPDVNRLLGFELLPGPHYPTDDPRGARAWAVGIDQPAGRVTMMGFTGRGLIRFAYGLGDTPGVGGPGWIDTETFDLAATTEGAPDEEAQRAALRTALEDRFKLSVHRESREFPVYALVTTGNGALGPNLRPSTSTCKDWKEWRVVAVNGGLVGQRPQICGAENTFTGMTFDRVTMADLAAMLSQPSPLLDRKVMDRTGIAGSFDGTLSLGPLPAVAVLTRYPATAPLLETLGVRTVFTALPQQLGLRLDDATATSDVVVIDRAERPS